MARPNRVVLVLLAVLAIDAWIPSPAQNEELRSANVADVGRGYRLSRLHGRKVLNDQSEQIGTVFEFVMGQDFMLFAILEIGDFLGLDVHFVAIPARTLVFNEIGRVILLPGATRRALRGFPAFHFEN
jgi:hypothetical protein